MKLFVLFSLFLFAVAPSWAELPYPLREFRDLSDKKISTQGENALKMNAESWKHAESDHFVYHFTDAREAETVLFHAEVYYSWVHQMLGLSEAPPSGKAHVFIFNDEKLWEEFRHRGTLERITGAEAYTDGKELFIHRVQFWLEPQRVLAHELTHIMLFRILGGQVPLYLNEGYAEFIGFKAIAMKFGGDEYTVHGLDKVPEKYYLPLSKLSAMRVYPQGIPETENFYLESQLLVRYLIDQYGPVKFYTFLQNVVEAKSLGYPLLQTYGISEADLEEKFRAVAMEPEAS